MRKVTVELRGGLANQLFQWAAGYIAVDGKIEDLRLTPRLVNRPVGRGDQLSHLGLNDRSNIFDSLSTRFWTLASRILPQRVSDWSQWHLVPVWPQYRKVRDYDELSVLNDASHVYLRGFFQERKILEPYRDVLAPIVVDNLDKISNVDDLPEQYSAMHIRRGDYVSNPAVSERFGICTDEYYFESAKKLPLNLPIVIVSDEPAKCGSIVSYLSSLGFQVIARENSSHFSDMSVLVKAKNLVLANSTFSWWGAFLGSSENVIAPDVWFNDQSIGSDMNLSTWSTVDRTTGIQK